MKANAVPCLLSSLVWIDHYNECNGMTGFMEFMKKLFWTENLRFRIFCSPLEGFALLEIFLATPLLLYECQLHLLYPTQPTLYDTNLFLCLRKLLKLESLFRSLILLSGDVGGSIGLYLGGSLLTLMECVDLLIWFCYKRDKKSQVIKVAEESAAKEIC